MNSVTDTRYEEFQSRIRDIYENKDKYVILDTETTGLSKTDEIVEISIIDLEGNVLLDTFVNPERNIPPVTTGIHGITDDMVADAPLWNDVWPQVQAILRTKKMIAYNAMFDVRMIRQSCVNHGIKAPFISQLCIMNICKDWKGYRPKLESFAKGEQEHRALADTLIILNDIILEHL